MEPKSKASVKWGRRNPVVWTQAAAATPASFGAVQRIISWSGLGVKQKNTTVFGFRENGTEKIPKDEEFPEGHL